MKSNGVELTWLTSSTPDLDLIDFVQKSHVLKDKRLNISQSHPSRSNIQQHS